MNFRNENDELLQAQPELPFRIIVAGGRDFNNSQLLAKWLDYYLQNITRPICIVCGGAKGADLQGRDYALAKKYQVKDFPANWSKYGKSAGFRRNELMAVNADALVAFWDGESHGTKHMIDYATKKGLPVKVVRY